MSRLFALPPAGTSTWPKMVVQVDFVNDPTSGVETWTDITPYVSAKTPPGGGTQLLACGRGRNYELAQTQAGFINLALNNTDGRFDPTNVASPYYTGAGNPGGLPGLVAPGRRIRIISVWNNISYNVWRGYVEDWPQTWSDGGFYGGVVGMGTDALSPLSAITLQALPVVEALKDTPLALYRLNDAASGAMAGNTSASNQPLAVIKSGTSTAGAAYAFGGPVGSGALAADPTSSLTFSPFLTAFGNTRGYLLRTADLGSGPLLQLGGWYVGGWLQTPSVSYPNNSSSDIFEQLDSTGRKQVEVSTAALTGAYSLTVTVTPLTGSSTTVTGTKQVSDDSLWHHWIVTLAPDNQTLTLYIDGVSQGTTVAAAAVTWAKPWINQFGGDLRPNFMSGGSFFSGNMKNLIVGNGTFTAARALANYQAGAGFPGESTDTRIGRLLDAASWPVAMRNLAAGDTKVGVQTTEGVRCLQALQQVNDTEVGNLYVDSQGRVSFSNRSKRYNPTSVAAFGELEIPYEGDIQMTEDPKEVYNEVVVSRQGGVTVRAVDSPSQIRNFPRTLTVATIAVDDATVVYTAEYLLDRYRAPHLRCPQLTLIPSASPTVLFPQALGREIGDCITVTRRGGSTISKKFFIEHISHTISRQEWKTTFLLSPAESSFYFTLDSPTYGRLGGGSTLNAGITAGATSLVTPDAVFSSADTPYDVLVGAERLTVTAATTFGTAPQTLTVTRGAGGTLAVAHTAGSPITLADTYPLAF